MLEKGHCTARNTALVQMPRLYLWQKARLRIGNVKAVLCPSLPAWVLQGGRIAPCCSSGVIPAPRMLQHLSCCRHRLGGLL